MNKYYIIETKSGYYAVMKSVTRGKDKIIVECESYEEAEEYIEERDDNY